MKNFIIFLVLIFGAGAMQAEETKDPSSDLVSLYFGAAGTMGALGKSFEFHMLGDFLVAEVENTKIMVGPAINLGIGWYKPFTKSINPVDVSCSIRAKHRFRMNDHNLDIFLRIPVGFSMVRFNPYSDRTGRQFHKDASVGFNAGLMAGAQFSFYKEFGAFAELGFLHRSFFAVTSKASTLHLPTGSAIVGLAIDL